MNAWAQIVQGYIRKADKQEQATKARQQSAEPTHKQCTACKETLPITAFYDRFPERSGRTAKCKRCICAQQKQAREKRTART